MNKSIWFSKNRPHAPQFQQSPSSDRRLSSQVSVKSNTLAGRIAILMAWFTLAASFSFAQAPQKEYFERGSVSRISQLPDGKLKSKLGELTPEARAEAMKRLAKLSFHQLDAAKHLRVDNGGGIYIVCPNEHSDCDDCGAHAPKDASQAEDESAAQAIETNEDPSIAQVPVSVDSPPIYNSKPDAPFHIYLDFNGAFVTGKAWVSEEDGSTTWDCFAWSRDSDLTNFSDAEQAEMRDIWERISEDYAPFDVNVTTDTAYDPDNYQGDKNKVGWLLFTPDVDKNGSLCPHFDAGGIAYVGVFGESEYFSLFQPAWVLTDTFFSASDMAEAGSHEMGHNMGLSHDGLAAGRREYYQGHNATTSAPSWGPIMGASYDREVTQWSQGGYFDSNQTQDDLAIIAAKISYRSDDHPSSFASATEWTETSVTESGIIEQTNSADYFKFSAGSGIVNFSAEAFRSDTGSAGSNLDLKIELYDANQNFVTAANPSSEVDASFSTSVTSGTYYLVVKPSGAGSPLTFSPSGYTSYGSLGQYTITGSFAPPEVDVIYLTSALGGETWSSGATRNITWYSDLGGNVKIELIKSGALYRTITASAPNNGSYSWPIPEDQAPGDSYRIRITTLEDPSKTDTSAATFGIVRAPIVVYSADMDSDPGWVFSHSSWAWGQPTGADQDSSGAPDPTSGFNGDNVIGYRLDGDYEANIPSARTATTPAFDCSDRENITLTFFRWLGVDRSSEDQASIEVSTNGTSWSTVWQNPDTATNDKAWRPVSYDISAVADDQPTVYLRWSLGSTNGQNNFCGWNLDNIKVYGDVIDDSALAVTSASGFSTSGLEGGPFSPDTFQYTLENTGTRPMEWIATHSTDWVMLDASGGTLAPGATTIVTGSINSNANALAFGDYVDTLGFFNTTTGTGDTTRNVNLTASQLGTLVVTDDENLESSGPVGEAFSPSAKSYTLENPGVTPIQWTANKSADWLSLSATGGTLTPGATTTVTVSFNGNATSLAIGSYDDVVTFTNDTSGTGDTTRTVALTVDPTPAIITITDLTFTYDGTPKYAQVTTDPPGITTDVTYNALPDGPINAGTHFVIATINDPDYSGEATAEMTIAKASQSITFAPLDPIDDDVPPVTLAGEASSGLDVVYTSSNTEVAVISEDTLVVAGPGLTTITASQPGDNNYLAATSVERTVRIFQTIIAGAVIYESFDDSDSTLAGNTPGSGLDGTWQGNGTVSADSLTYGNLSAPSGNKASVNNQNGHIQLNSDLSSRGLLDDGAELWFSVLVKVGSVTNSEFGFALGTDQINAGTGLPITNNGKAIGFTLQNNALKAANWSPVINRSMMNRFNEVSPETTYLIVGKLNWGASTDALRIYLPSSNLEVGELISAHAINVDQTLFDTISFTSSAVDTAPQIDEIRFGASYESVLGYAAPRTVDYFEISTIDSPQNIGTEITGVTITARNSVDEIATEFNGTVTFDGTAGITGTSANFVDGVLTDVAITPTITGPGLTFTVDDGEGHTGSTTFTVLGTFDSWSGGSDLTADDNNDGIDNGIAWVYGASNPSQDATGMIPSVDNASDPDYLIFSYRRSDTAFADPAASIIVEYSSDLETWTPATHDGTNVIITESDDFHANGIDKVEVKLNRDLATGEQIFARLNLTYSP